MLRHQIRLGFSGFVLLFGLAGWASAEDGPIDGPASMSYPSDSAVSSNCGPGANYGCCCSAPQLWDAGVEGSFLHVLRSDPPGVNIATTVPHNEEDPASSELNSDYGVGARFWLGVELGDCWGVRGRFWSFRDNALGIFGDPRTLNGVGTGDFTEAGYNLSAYTIDVEATKAWGWGPWCLEGSFGGRYGQMHQDSLLAFYDDTDGTTAFGSSSRRIFGTGLTGAIEVHRCLGGSGCCSGCSCCSCVGWSVFANARGSVLWGTSSGFATAAADDNSGTFDSSFESVADPTTIYIFESQVGVEWSHPVKCVCGTLFVRGACEYQRWSANNAGTTVATAVASDAATTVVNSQTLSPTVGMLGLTVAAGFRY